MLSHGKDVNFILGKQRIPLVFYILGPIIFSKTRVGKSQNYAVHSTSMCLHFKFGVFFGKIKCEGERDLGHS